jgi:AraC-like DNA-binding protein
VVSLERVVDGLDVTFEPLVVSNGGNDGPPCRRRDDASSVRYTRGGAGVLHLAGSATVRFSGDQVVIVPPHPGRHVLPGERVSGSSCPRTRGERAWSTGADGAGGDPDAVVVRGRVRVTYQGCVGLFDHVREPLVERLTPDDPLRGSFQELFDEIAAQRPGYRAMAEALLRRCLILLLRRLCSRGGQRRLPWLAPLEDSRLGRAAAAMQERPEHAFTLPALAEVAGMSRSVFAARFADALGQSPIGYLKALRLTRATRLLLGTDLPVKSVATRVGYSSRSSFTRAFIAYHGVSPVAFRAAACGPASAAAWQRQRQLRS